MGAVDKGKVMFTPKQNYNSATSYSQLDTVLYNGSSWVWVNPQSGSGVTPSDSATTYWFKLAQGMADYVEVSDYPTASNVTMNKIYHKTGTSELKRTVRSGTEGSYTYEWEDLAGGGSGDTADCTVIFAEAETDADINSGDTHATLFGKIKKRFSVIGSNISTILSGKVDIANISMSAAVTEAGYVADARQMNPAVPDSLAYQVAQLNGNMFNPKEITLSWAEISARVTAGNYEGINVGDYKTFTLTTDETVTMEIAGINLYVDSVKYPQYHIDWVSRDCLATAQQMNATNTNTGGWAASALRTLLNGTIYDTLPADLKAVISEKQHLSSNKGSWDWINDKLWLPTEIEVFGFPSWSEVGYGTGGYLHYPLFRRGYRYITKRQGNGGSVCTWWLSSPDAGSTTSICYVGRDGVAYGNGASNAYGVPLCFRIKKVS